MFLGRSQGCKESLENTLRTVGLEYSLTVNSENVPGSEEEHSMTDDSICPEPKV